VAGEVVEVNQELVGSPQWVNEDPYGDAWFIKLRISNPEELKDLFSASEYEEYVAEESTE
jgi:glycine cleavage system H protein